MVPREPGICSIFGLDAFSYCSYHVVTETPGTGDFGELFDSDLRLEDAFDPGDSWLTPVDREGT